MQNREERLKRMLNALFAIKPITYGELSKVVPFNDKVTELRALEKLYPELGLARFGTDQEGISTKSLISTITRVLTDGDTLAYLVEGTADSPAEAENDRIIGVTWLQGQVE